VQLTTDVNKNVHPHDHNRNYPSSGEQELATSNRQENIWYWIFFAMGLFWTIFLLLSSPGVYIHDEVGHFLISQNAWNYPELMLDVWGRPLNTLLYMIPAKWGLTATRFLSLLMACLTVWLTTKVSELSGGRRLYLIPLLLWFQPWFNSFSYQAITEVPFSLCMIFGVSLWMSAREKSAAIVFGILPLIRHEGIVISSLYFMYMVYRRRRSTGTLTFLPLVAYNVMYFGVLLDWPFRVFLDAKSTGEYGHGSWFHFFPRLAYRAGLPVILLSLLALPLLLKQPRRFLYLAGYIAYFLVHTVIYRFGLFASGGYTVFLLPLAPALAITAGLGGEKLMNHLETPPTSPSKNTLLLRRLLQTLIVAVALSVLIVGFTSRPVPVDDEGLAMQAASQWIDENGYTDKPIVASHVLFVYYHDLPWKPAHRWDMPIDLANLPDSCLLIWDRHYSEPWGVQLSYLMDSHNGWQKLREFRGGVAILFQKHELSQHQ